MTKEQDAKFREICEPAGCAVVPMPVMRKMLEMLRALQGEPT